MWRKCFSVDGKTVRGAFTNHVDDHSDVNCQRLTPLLAVVGAAPCQCFSPGAMQTTSPGRISSIGPPQRCASLRQSGQVIRSHLEK